MKVLAATALALMLSAVVGSAAAAPRGYGQDGYNNSYTNRNEGRGSHRGGDDAGALLLGGVVGYAIGAVTHNNNAYGYSDAGYGNQPYYTGPVYEQYGYQQDTRYRNYQYANSGYARPAYYGNTTYEGYPRQRDWREREVRSDAYRYHDDHAWRDGGR